MNQRVVKQELSRNFPQFQHKQSLIQLFVSLEVPQKQSKMLNWWQQVIQFLIRYHKKVYINYQELVNCVSFYGLKPTPLKAVIDYLASKDIFTAENEMQTKIISAQRKKDTSKSWFNTIFSLVSNKQEKSAPIFTYSGKEKIFSKQLKQLKKEEIKKLLHVFFGDHLKSLNEFKLIKQLEGRVNLDTDSIRQLLKQLSLQGVILKLKNNRKPFIIYSQNIEDLKDVQWIDIQTLKHSLREQIQKFNDLISLQQHKKKIKPNEKEFQIIQGKPFYISKNISQRQIYNGNKKSIQLLKLKNLFIDKLALVQEKELNIQTKKILKQFDYFNSLLMNQLGNQQGKDSDHNNQAMKQSFKTKFKNKIIHYIKSIQNIENQDKLINYFYKRQRGQINIQLDKILNVIGSLNLPETNQNELLWNIIRNNTTLTYYIKKEIVNFLMSSCQNVKQNLLKAIRQYNNVQKSKIQKRQFKKNEPKKSIVGCFRHLMRQL